MSTPEMERLIEIVRAQQVEVRVEPAPGALPQTTWGRLISIEPYPAPDSTDEGTKP